MWLRGYIYNSSYYQIRSINLSHCCHMFPWLCAWGGCSSICCPFDICIYNRESWVFCPLLLCSPMMCANNKVHYDPMGVLICLDITFPDYHNYADLSEHIELLKCLSVTLYLECVSKVKSVLSVIFHAIYGASCIQLTHFSYDAFKNMCTLFYIIKSEVWPFCHCLGLGQETMICTICLLSFSYMYRVWAFPCVVMILSHTQFNTHMLIYYHPH